MNPFEYVAVLVSIVIGLAVTDILVSLHRLLRAGPRVRWDWAAPAAALLALTTLLFIWWSFYQPPEEVTAMRLGGFLPIMAALVLLFLMAGAALPDEVPPEGIDLRTYYERNGRYFWGLYAGLVGWLFAAEFAPAAWRRLQAGEPLSAVLANHAFDVIGLGLFASLAIVRRRWWHAVALAIVLVASIFSWVARTVG
jgi:hypothetical protein